MLRERKDASIYGGGGASGSAVARAFAAEGARAYLAGRTPEKLDKAAEVIRGDGGQAQTARLDALAEKAVDAHADGVARDAGSIDISFNLITHGDVQGAPLVEMTPEDFARPVETAVRTMFLTSRTSSRRRC
jgi:3-oxoacyl-[acyl-carrier protein] reductase